MSDYINVIIFFLVLCKISNWQENKKQWLRNLTGFSVDHMVQDQRFCYKPKFVTYGQSFVPLYFEVHSKIFMRLVVFLQQEAKQYTKNC
jgi:hypothetical protein